MIILSPPNFTADKRSSFPFGLFPSLPLLRDGWWVISEFMCSTSLPAINDGSPSGNWGWDLGHWGSFWLGATILHYSCRAEFGAWPATKLQNQGPRETPGWSNCRHHHWRHWSGAPRRTTWPQLRLRWPQPSPSTFVLSARGTPRNWDVSPTSHDPGPLTPSSQLPCEKPWDLRVNNNPPPLILPWLHSCNYPIGAELIHVLVHAVSASDA